MNKRKVLIFDWGGVIAGDNNKIASKILSDKYDLDYNKLYNFICDTENKYLDVKYESNFFLEIASEFSLSVDEVRNELEKVGPNKEILNLIFKLKKKYDLFLLSDQITFKSNDIRKKLLPNPFVKMFFSNELELSKYKSNNIIYDVVLDKINSEFDYNSNYEVYFIDNNKTNIKFANKTKINGILFETFEKLVLDLKKLNIL